MSIKILEFESGVRYAPGCEKLDLAQVETITFYSAKNLVQIQVLGHCLISKGVVDLLLGEDPKHVIRQKSVGAATQVAFQALYEHGEKCTNVEPPDPELLRYCAFITKVNIYCAEVIVIYANPDTGMDCMIALSEECRPAPEAAASGD